MKIKKLGKKNAILTIILIVLLLVAGGSLAFFGWSSTSEGKDRIVDVTVNSGSGECSKLTDNTKLLVPTSSREGGRIITMKAKQIMAENAVITWTLTVNKLNTDDTTTSGLKNESFRYELINNTTGVSYGNGNFANITDENNTITFRTVEETLEYNVDYEFILYLWIDGDTFGNNPLDMASQTYDFDMNCSITGILVEPDSMATHITNLYINSEKTEVETASGISYNYATSEQLMNDRLGNSQTSIDGGNIRYYGTNPKNYVLFNCKSYPSTECEIWRIIGVFDGKVKIIKNSILGDYAWDYDYNNDLSSETYSNDWNNSSLKTLLNGAYLNNINTTYYYRTQTGPSSYTSILQTLNFNTDKTGIKDSTRRAISDTTYYLGAFDYDSIAAYPDQIYINERKDNKCSTCTYKTTWSGKIALPYVSDYAYAATLGENNCNQVLNNYSDSKCSSVNWINSIVTNLAAAITPSKITSTHTCYFILDSGIICAGSEVSTRFNIYPVLYLNSNVGIDSTSGDGSEGSPYRISIS